MTVKEQLLATLEKNRGQYTNGTVLAKSLGATKAAVSKAAKALCQEGFQIDKVPNKGYRLFGSMLTAEGIFNNLIDKRFDISVLQQTDSTNTQAKKAANLGAKEGVVIAARGQTAGRGRLGRNFFSPTDSGIYFSVVLRPSFPVNKSVYLTTLTAVAVVQALQQVLGVDAKIKWVNDIYVGEKKVCGILTEGQVNIETGMLDYAIIGVGLNITPPQEDFPQEIKNIAGCVAQQKSEDTNNILTAAILDNLIKYYDLLPQKDFLETYRQKSFLDGKTVLVCNNGKSALVEGISEDLCLMVKYDDGSRENLDSGEVNIKYAVQQ